MSLDDLRREIDGIDGKLVRLLNERADTAIRIGERKVKENSPVHVVTREDEVLERVKELNKGPLPDETVISIYRQIISACLEVQETKHHD